MIKKIAVLVILITQLPLFGQQKGVANISKIDVSYFTSPPSDSMKKRFTSASYPMGFNHTGTLEEGIAILLNKPSNLIKFNKNISDIFVSFEARTKNFSLAKTLILEELKSGFRFRVSDIEDSTDVWVMTRINEKKLWIYTDDRVVRGNGASIDYEDTWEICGMEMNYLVHDIALYSKRTIIYTGETKNRYIFEIPLKLIDNFDGLPEYLLENYGLALVKEKRLINKLYVEFY